MVIGVFGRNPFGDELEIEIKDLQVNGHPVVCKPVARASDARLVHLLFVPANEESSLNELVKELQQAHVLTVGETPGFAAAGGMINFLREGDKVRFDINAFSADQAGLRISAQLQKLAKTVRKKN
ncbi:MAG: hypothetical protein JWM16_3811 [Verrucomicrobiales bacterium]|nr:hypothetical protein [Verrucomicrobiales bacterium]